MSPVMGLPRIDMYPFTRIRSPVIRKCIFYRLCASNLRVKRPQAGRGEGGGGWPDLRYCNPPLCIPQQIHTVPPLDSLSIFFYWEPTLLHWNLFLFLVSWVGVQQWSVLTPPPPHTFTPSLNPEKWLANIQRRGVSPQFGLGINLASYRRETHSWPLLWKIVRKNF